MTAQDVSWTLKRCQFGLSIQQQNFLSFDLILAPQCTQINSRFGFIRMVIFAVPYRRKVTRFLKSIEESSDGLPKDEK
jgi:hypothetical protein